MNKTTIKDNIRKTMNSKATLYLPYILLGLVILLFLIYIVNKITLKENNCLTLKNLYTSPPNIKNIDFTKNNYKHELRDYYIKSSYNSCCGGHFKDDYVSICALENVIKNGARFLDFEIYAKDDMPIIASSSNPSYSFKETYNHIEFEEAMKKIRDIAFTDITVNHNDPLILNFRIKTNSVNVHNIMAKDIYYAFGRNFINHNFKFENSGNNLGEVKLEKLKRTVIIAVDKSNLTYKSTKLYTYVNMASNSSFLRTYRNYDIQYSSDLEEITNFNKANMSIALPDYKENNENVFFMKAKEAGFQIIAMNFQNFDAAFKMYSLVFDTAGSAFVLKPDHLRFSNILLDDSTPSTEFTDGTPNYNCDDIEYKTSKDIIRSFDDGQIQTPDNNIIGPYDGEDYNDYTSLYQNVNQKKVNYINNCNSINSKMEGYTWKNIMGENNIPTLYKGVPSVDYFEEYRLSKEVDSGFSKNDTNQRHKHWEDTRKNWGHFYCQQYQDEKGKCDVKDEIDDNGYVTCKSQNWAMDNWIELKIKNKMNKKKKEKRKKENKERRKEASKSKWVYTRGNRNRIKEINSYDDYDSMSSGFRREGPMYVFKGNKSRFDNNDDLVEVDKCEDYNGIIGIHYGHEDNSDTDTNYNRIWDNLDNTSDITFLREEHCQKAIFGYDENNEPKKCQFDKVIPKNTTFLDKLNRKKLDNDTNNDKFFEINCKKP